MQIADIVKNLIILILAKHKPTLANIEMFEFPILPSIDVLLGVLHKSRHIFRKWGVLQTKSKKLQTAGISHPYDSFRQGFQILDANPTIQPKI